MCELPPDLFGLQSAGSVRFSLWNHLLGRNASIKLECHVLGHVSLVSGSYLINPPDAHISVFPCKVAVSYVLVFNRLLQVS